MNKEDIIRKLTSRKFFALLTGLVTTTLIMWNVPENQIAQIIASIGAFGTIISYIFVEGTIDSNRPSIDPTAPDKKES